MIWDRFLVLRSLFPTKASAQAVGRRWTAAMRADSRLRHDLIRLGGVLVLQPVAVQDGIPEVEPIDPLRLAYEAGRRDFALQLLALSGLSFEDLNTLMEDDDV